MDMHKIKCKNAFYKFYSLIIYEWNGILREKRFIAKKNEILSNIIERGKFAVENLTTDANASFFLFMGRKKHEEY